MTMNKQKQKKGQTSRLVLFHYLLLSVKSNFVV